MTQNSVPAHLKSLYEAAKAARLNSYSPYSNQKVGAAIQLKDGRVFGGCNIENSSYGGTNCAERVAIQKAVSEIGPGIEIDKVLVVTDATPPWSPCGICRQVVAEFGPKAEIYLTNLKGEFLPFTLEQLLPLAFTPDRLLKS